MKRILNVIEDTREYIVKEIRHNEGSFYFNADVREHVLKSFSTLIGKTAHFMESKGIKYNYSTAVSKEDIINEVVRKSYDVIKMFVASNASYEKDKARSNLYFNLDCRGAHSVEDILEAFDEFVNDMKWYDYKEHLLGIGYHGPIVLELYDKFFDEVNRRLKEYIKEGADMEQENEVDLSFLDEEEQSKSKDDIAASDVFFDEVISGIKSGSTSTPITSDNLDYINPNYRVKKEYRADSNGSSESSFNGDVNIRLATLEEKVDKILEILSQR